MTTFLDDPFAGQTLSFLDGPGPTQDTADPPARATPLDDGGVISSTDDAGPVADLVCEICGDGPIPWSGRGRKPKAHKECRAAARASGDGTTRTVRRKTTIDVTDPYPELVEELCQGVGEMAGTMAYLTPVTAVTMTQDAPRAMKALVRIAGDWERRGHPGMLNGLRMAAESVAYGTVGNYAAAVIYAVGVDAGRLDPDSLVAEKLGVRAAAIEAGWRPEHIDHAAQYVPTGVTEGQFAPPPPAYSGKL